MSRTDSWARAFLCERLDEMESVLSYELQGSHSVRVRRRDLGTVTVVGLGVDEVTSSDFDELDNQIASSDFVVSIRKAAAIRESAFRRAEALGVGVGTFSDFLRAMGERDMRSHQAKDASFVLRSLRQHSNVEAVRRTDDKKYRIARRRGGHLVAVMLYDYDVSADSVRTAYDLYRPTNLLVCANPNARVSRRATEAVRSIGVTLVSNWSSLLGILASGA